MRYFLAVLVLAIAACAKQNTKRSTLVDLQIKPVVTDTVAWVTVVKVCVNWKGDVISADFLPEMSTTTDTSKINQSVRVAKTYKFEERQGSAVPCGTITFKYKPNQK
ncbi:MAG TPA: hypothetical protein DCF33_06620 [Saprospirales bacterium]|nr:hypothetical protein [Saprospirales bacterium]